MDLDLFTLKVMKGALVRTKDRLNLIAQTSMTEDNARIYAICADLVYTTLDEVLAAFITLVESSQAIKKEVEEDGKTL